MGPTLLLYVTLPLLLGSVIGLEPSLYDLEDPILELYPDTFGRVVYNKDTAFLLEFYSSQCGYCIRFAPHFKELSYDLENWNNVVKVAAVNCIDPINTELCRKYDVAKYPTIRFFGAHTDETEKGAPYDEDRDLWRIRSHLIDFLQQQKPYPQSWPSLEDSKSYSVWDFFDKMPSNVDTAYIFIERPESYTGREVILDLSGKRNIVIQRILTTNTALMHELINQFSNSTYAVFVKIFRNGSKQVLNIFDRNMDTDEMRDLVYETLVGETRVNVRNSTDNGDDKDHKVLKGVYMSDLENTLSNILHLEVSVHQEISGAKLTALKDFLSILRLYFPGSATTVNYLSKLHTWVDSRKGNLTGERFANALELTKSETAYLPDKIAWTGCKGSRPELRGYNCGLWTLFHTLTVQAYKMYDLQNGNNNLNPLNVLYAVRGYVIYFFSCDGCSRHFQEMSANLDKEATSPKDTILWLWQAHNKVNKRLAGDEAEDPKHPKIQFPSEEACDKCRFSTTKDGIEWDQNAVLRYLLHYYKKENIKPRGTDLAAAPTQWDSVVTVEKQPNLMKLLFPNSNLIWQ